MQQMTVGIAGMHCGGCVSAVRKKLSAVPGAHVDAVTVGSATVSYDTSRTDPAAIAQAIRDAGYQPVAEGAPSIAGPAGGGCCGGGSA